MTSGKLILLLFFYLQVISIKAQVTTGVTVGFSRNYYNINIDKLTYTQNTAEYGFVFSVPISYRINNWVSLKTSFTYFQKNYSYTRTGQYTGIYTKFTNSYLQLPVMAAMEYGNSKIKGFLNAGIYGAYWLKGTIKGKIPNIYSVTDYANNNGQLIETFNLTGFNQKYTFDSRKDKRFEFGWLSGVGTMYFLNKRNSLVAEADYFHAITRQQKNYMINQKAGFNQTIAFTIGYIYQL